MAAVKNTDVKRLEQQLLDFGEANYGFEESEVEVEHGGAYVPSETTANAASDMQLLAYAHRDGIYMSIPPIFEVPRNMWVLFSKPIKGAAADAPKAVSVRIRELYDSAPVVECAAVAVTDPAPSWRLFPVENCVDVHTTFETLSSAVHFLRKLSQMSSLLPMHQDYENISMPEIKSWIWVGEQFLHGTDPDPATLTPAILANNQAVFQDLLDAPHSAKTRLQEEPFSQPHVWIGRLVFKGCRFALGYVCADRVWVLLHACQSWARASYALADLLASLNN